MGNERQIRGFLREKFQICRVPSYYWLLCLLKMVKPASMNKCFNEWVMSMLPEKKAETISLDGKTVRSTEKMKSYPSPLHIVSAQLGELGLTYAQKAVEGKSNEIPAVQKLLEELDINGCIVVADALNSQKETAKIVVKGKVVQQSLNIVRKIALNLIKRYKQGTSSKLPLSNIMLNCLIDPSMMMRILNV